jgi:5-(carboxyamino)imidazole ribonucleotide synthase
VSASAPVIAIIGGGQLGRMLALAGIPLGYRFRFLDPAADCPAAAVGEVVVGAFDDEAAIERLVRDSIAVTYEFENVPVKSADVAAAHGRLAPSPRSLAIAQDRIAEKDFFRACGVPVQPYAAVSGDADLAKALERVGVPGVLKTRQLGYDGKGQCVIRNESALAPAFASLGRVPCIYEAFVPFEREVSVVATRAASGAFVAHPVCRNEHVGGILRLTVAADPDATVELARDAERHVRTIAERLGHVGTLAVEFFVVAGSLVANEMAPRVHNSGHWTIEGAVTSQFVNHIRAVAGLPLGDPSVRGAAAMVNLIGEEPPLEDLLRIGGAHVHRYGKSPRAGRKLGHVTVVGREFDDLLPSLETLRALTGASAGAARRH